MDGPANGPAANEETITASAEDAANAEKAKPASAGPNPDGQVVLTAKGPVWLKIYDADNKRIYETEMKAGDSYQLPKDANGPMILTGRPEMLAVTIDGTAMPPLGVPEKTISDVGISASALIERAAAAKAEASEQQNAVTNSQ